MWKLWKKKLTACWARLVAKRDLWKTCEKAGKSRSPAHFGTKTVSGDGVMFSTKSGLIFHRFFHRQDFLRSGMENWEWELVTTTDNSECRVRQPAEYFDSRVRIFPADAPARHE